MTQTRRRRTKHRGNAAGIVEARGRTGRKPTAAEKGGDSKTVAKQTARERREAKLNTPPTWKGAFNRALLATALMMALFVFVLRPKNAASFIVLLPLILLIYTPMGYYTDLFLYRRRQRQKKITTS
jgi:hypothetical protein